MAAARIPFTLLLSSALLAPLAVCQTLTGTIVDSAGSPVAGATIVLSNGAPGAVTALNGTFAITGIRARTYDMQIVPPTLTVAADLRTIVVAASGTTALGTIALADAHPLTATVVDGLGLPVVGATIGAFTLDGSAVFTPANTTNAVGFGQIALAAGTPVTVRIIPPFGAALIPHQFAVTPTAPVNLGTAALAPGHVVTGHLVRIVNGTSLPVPGASIVTTDSATSAEVLQVTPLTDALGTFTLLLPTGLCDLEFLPAPGFHLVAARRRGVPVLGATALGEVPLSTGWSFRGNVVGPAGPVRGAACAFVDAQGHVFTSSRATTDIAGAVDLVVPSGLYSFRVTPPANSGLVGTVTSSVTIVTDTVFGNLQLASGAPVDIDVRDANGAPVPGATLELTDTATGRPIPLASPVADGIGRIRTTAPRRLVDARIAAPRGSRSGELAFAGIAIGAPVQALLALPTKTMRTDLVTFAPGVVTTIPNGGPLQIDWSIANQTTAPQTIVVDAVHLDGNGAATPWVPAIVLPLSAGFATTFALSLPTPILPSSELDFEQRLEVRVRDAASGALLDHAAVRFVPR